jgi:transposase
MKELAPTYLLGAKLIENRGCQLLYLPPYSPDLNPIEEALRPSGC